MKRKPNSKTNKPRYIWMNVIMLPFLYVCWLLSHEVERDFDDRSMFDNEL